MTSLSPELAECIQAIDATFERIERTFEQSRRDYEQHLVAMAEAQRRFDAVKRGRAE